MNKRKYKMQKGGKNNMQKKLPIGIENFEDMIKEIIDEMYQEEETKK